MKTICLATIALLFMKAWHADAELYLTSDPTFGPNSVTVDTSTELGWLNLSFTTDLSYYQVIADTQPGGILSGYRFATVQEVDGLYKSAGLPTLGGYPPSTPAIPYLFSLVGTTDPNEITARSGTLVVPNQPNEGAYAPSIYLINAPLRYFVSEESEAVGPLDSGSNLGNWLVKEVPEPADSSLFVLIGALFTGFIFAQRRKRKLVGCHFLHFSVR